MQQILSGRCFQRRKQSGRHYTHEGWRPLAVLDLSVALVVNEAAQVIGA